MIPEDVIGHVAHQCEMYDPADNSTSGVLLVNKSDGPGRWRWQIVTYRHEQGMAGPISTTADSSFSHSDALVSYEEFVSVALGWQESKGRKVAILI